MEDKKDENIFVHVTHMDEIIHTPVLLKEVLEIFNPQSGERYIDATVNGGGHTKEILDRIGEGGLLFGIDRDATLISRLKNKFATRENLIAICDSYRELDNIGITYGFDAVHGILFDLGFSSYHVDGSGRGFSFLRDEPLDMRYNPEKTVLNAYKIVNSWSKLELARMGKEYGDERFAGKIAELIVRERAHTPIVSTFDLVRIIRKAIPARAVGKIHPATKTFQALRIAVNDELGELKVGLEKGIDLLASGGKMIVISFHSLEDAIVKETFRLKEKKGTVRLITKKPITARPEEAQKNPRARSAKLRALIKI